MDLKKKSLFIWLWLTKGTTKEEEATFPIFLECFCSGNFPCQNSATFHSEEQIIAKPWAHWERRGNLVNMRDRSDGRWHSAPPFGGTDRIFFVLAVATAMIAQWPGTKQKHFWFILCLGQDQQTFSPQSPERRVGSLCQIAIILTSFPSSGVLCPSPIVFAIVSTNHVWNHP